ncbi:proteasome assembly chaperone 1 [Biomphalaria pfeifferi]|uniref:Proteasome assembly chaperone 1 n=1 Tax=Biomphalaria pfeifferi TaxID=112525 RepID=A0AAD8EZA7_BIOPF|nr:proteasome assembly chaperone 1 [Biomphalaria pfeifferi]
MATYFGEVLPVSSRAVDLDDDEDENDDELPQTLPSPVLQWSVHVQEELNHSKDKKLSCSKFLLAYGIEANAFADIYLIKQSSFEQIGSIFTSSDAVDEATGFKDSRRNKTCSIFRDSNDSSALVCMCKRDVLPEESHTWTKLILDNIDLSHAVITVLTSFSTGNYSSEIPQSQLKTPFLRCLKTTEYTAAAVCPALEQPNMLTGFPAMLMTFFQVQKYKAIIFVCYKENRFIEVANVKSFLKAALPFTIRTNLNTETMLVDLTEKHAIHDMIYM